MKLCWDASSSIQVSSPRRLISHPLLPMGLMDDTLTFEVVRPWDKCDSHITINFVPLIKHMNIHDCALPQNGGTVLHFQEIIRGHS